MDDDGFYDRRVNVKPEDVESRIQQTLSLPSASVQHSSPPGATSEGGSNLAQMLQAAQLKASQSAATTSAAASPAPAAKQQSLNPLLLQLQQGKAVKAPDNLLSAPSAPAAVGAAGASAAANPLHQLLARAGGQAAAKDGPAAGTRSKAAAPAEVPRKQQGQQQAVRAKVRKAFEGLMQNDAFVDMVAAEFREAGLIQ